MISVVVYWILIIPGYIGVDGKQFDTREHCREYAINRYKDTSINELPEEWTCRGMRENRPLPFKFREYQVD